VTGVVLALARVARNGAARSRPSTTVFSTNVAQPISSLTVQVYLRHPIQDWDRRPPTAPSGPLGGRLDHAPTFAGHAYTYPGYAAFMPLNSFVHLATLIIEGTFGRHPDLRFVFADGGYDILTPLMWRLDTFWMSMRDQTPWVDRYPGEYLRDHVRFCSSAFDGPTDATLAERWLDRDPSSARRTHRHRRM
jgi:hypothetical protein